MKKEAGGDEKLIFKFARPYITVIYIGNPAAICRENYVYDYRIPKINLFQELDHILNRNKWSLPRGLQ